MAGSLLSAEEWFSHGEKIGRVTMAASAVAIHMAGGKTLKYVVSVAGESVELLPGELTSATVECEPVWVALDVGADMATKSGWETVVLEGPGVTKIIAASLAPYKKAVEKVVADMFVAKVPLDALPWTNAQPHAHGTLVTHVWKDHLIGAVCVHTRAHGSAPTYAAQMKVAAQAIAEWPGAVDDAVKKTQDEAASKFAEQLAHGVLVGAAKPGHSHAGKVTWLDALAEAQASVAKFTAKTLDLQGPVLVGSALLDLIKTNPATKMSPHPSKWAAQTPVGTREWIEDVALDMGMAVVIAHATDGYTVVVGAYVHDGSPAPQEWCYQLRERLSEEGHVGVEWVVKPLTPEFAQKTSWPSKHDDLFAAAEGAAFWKNFAEPGGPLTPADLEKAYDMVETASFGPKSHFLFKGLLS